MGPAHPEFGRASCPWWHQRFASTTCARCSADIVRVLHSRAASILPRRPCPTIWTSSSPALGKELYGEVRKSSTSLGASQIIPVPSSRRQYTVLAQLLAQEPREPSRTMWSQQASTALYTDASGWYTTGWTSVLESPHEATRSSVGWWAWQKVLEMIALKELKACRHGLHQNVEALSGRTVSW
jgi:hypothetical protein